MSRVAKSPIRLPQGVEVRIDQDQVEVKGPKGTLHQAVLPSVQLNIEDGVLGVSPANEQEPNWAMAGTMRALLNNMVTGVSVGFERKLELVGVGYRAQAQGQTLNLTLGFSHPVSYPVPDGVTVETPTQTEILVRGADKSMVGQVAAVIRGYRPPEPYKGKGVKYSDEIIVRKEAKKK